MRVWWVTLLVVRAAAVRLPAHMEAYHFPGHMFPEPEPDQPNQAHPADYKPFKHYKTGEPHAIQPATHAILKRVVPSFLRLVNKNDPAAVLHSKPEYRRWKKAIQKLPPLNVSRPDPERKRRELRERRKKQRFSRVKTSEFLEVEARPDDDGFGGDQMKADDYVTGFAMGDMHAPCFISGADFHEAQVVPKYTECKTVWRTLKRWKNTCGAQIPYMRKPGREFGDGCYWYDDRPKCAELDKYGEAGLDCVGPEDCPLCMEDEETGDPPKCDPSPGGECEPVEIRHWAEYEQFTDHSRGWWTLPIPMMGQLPNLVWEIRPEYQSEDYRLAVIWIDTSERPAMISGPATNKTSWTELLPSFDAKSRYIHWFAYDISTLSHGTMDPIFLKSAKAGKNSYNVGFLGQCTWPLGFPPRERNERLSFRLVIYHHKWSFAPKHDYLFKFEKALDWHDLYVTECEMHAKSLKRTRLDVPPNPEPFIVLDDRIPECDGFFLADNYPWGKNQSDPCGAFGCPCPNSPGNC